MKNDPRSGIIREPVGRKRTVIPWRGRRIKLHPAAAHESPGPLGRAYPSLKRQRAFTIASKAKSTEQI